MRKLSAALSLVCIVALCTPGIGYGQYYGERVLEKTFEHTDFFFAPAYLNPFGIGSFGSAAPGLVDNPLLNLQVNPASPASDTLDGGYAYVDFRSSRELEDRYAYYPHLDYLGAYSRELIYYPTYYARTRRAPEPLFSGAYLFRPLGRRQPGFVVGATYQAIFQDEPYYAVPAGIYRAQLGYDYAGNRMVSEQDIPIIDRFQGSDNMRQVGHFANLLAAFRVAPGVDAGLRLSRVLFDRDGAYGSENLWNYTMHHTSYRRSLESRTQDYGHWDLEAGLNVHVAGQVTAGLAAGYLWGDALQELSRADSAHYGTGTVGVGTNWSYYLSTGSADQHWDHDGGAYYGGANLTVRLSEAQRFNLYYRLLREDVDLQLQSTIRDTSYSNYYHQDDAYRYSSESYYAVSDVRTGTGRRAGLSHRLAAALQWRLDEKTQLNLGANLQVQRRQTNTREDVFAYTRHYWAYDHVYGGQQQSQEQSHLREEAKELRWDFEAHTVGLQVPVLFTRRFSDAVELLFGINRRMTSWTVTDVTLAVFDYRLEVENGTTRRREHFGERYTAPREQRTDVRTTVLGGLTVFPTERFNVRLLAVPDFASQYGDTRLREFLWWISFNLTP